MRSLFRPEPRLPAAAFTTYAIAAPLATHWRAATCAEVDCPAYLRGWRTHVDPATDRGAAQAHYIRADSGRRFVEDRDEHGQLLFTFESGQTCFAQHRAPLEREPIFVRRGGDWRGNPLGDQLLHQRAADWLDDFATHQQRVADAHNRG
jgi:hypothetical protein